MPSQFLKVALEAAKNAEDIITAYCSEDVKKIELKKDEMTVTPADREAEKAIRETIKQAFSDHGFLGKVYGTEEGKSPYLWIIDPIDNTDNYIGRGPFFATQIALMKDEEPILGISNELSSPLGYPFSPFYNELLYAEAGSGAFLNGEPVHVSDVADLKDTILCLGDFSG